nr:hypothetical protein GCM10020092_025820 [Actinoplanes digitatis]
MGEEQVVLEHHADRPALGVRPQSAVGPVEVVPGQGDVSGGERLEPGQGAQRGGLAGTVGAEQGDHLPGADAQRHVEAEGAPVDEQVRVEDRAGSR